MCACVDSICVVYVLHIGSTSTRSLYFAQHTYFVNMRIGRNAHFDFVYLIYLLQYPTIPLTPILCAIRPPLQLNKPCTDTFCMFSLAKYILVLYINTLARCKLVHTNTITRFGGNSPLFVPFVLYIHHIYS